MSRRRPPRDDTASSELRAPHSTRFPDELVEDARRIFQERTDRNLTSEDARQMLENLTGFFSVLWEWDCARIQQEREMEEDASKES